MAPPFFIMLSDPPWAGPTAFRIAGSDRVMNKGRKLSADPGLITFELRVDAKAGDPSSFPPLDWHDPSGGQPLFSRRMVELLQRVGVSNIDWYSAHVSHQPTGAVLDYCVANVVGLVAALDLAASDVVSDSDGFIFGIKSMRLDPAKCQGLDIFRLKEMPNTLIVSAALAQHIRSAGLTGMRLIEDREWQQGMI